MSKLANKKTIEEHNKELEHQVSDLEILLDRLTKDVQDIDKDLKKLEERIEHEAKRRDFNATDITDIENELKRMKQDQDDMWELIAGKDADRVKRIVREARGEQA